MLFRSDYKTRTLMTSKDNQRSIMLRIYQGESKYVAENELLGTFMFSGLREAPKGAVKVEVTFHIDSEGILNLTARDLDTGQLVESRLKLGKDNESPASASVGGAKKKVVKKKPGAPEQAEEPEAPPPVPLAMPSTLETTFKFVTTCWNCAPLLATGMPSFMASVVKASMLAHRYCSGPSGAWSSM